MVQCLPGDWELFLGWVRPWNGWGRRLAAYKVNFKWVSKISSANDSYSGNNGFCKYCYLCIDTWISRSLHEWLNHYTTLFLQLLFVEICLNCPRPHEFNLTTTCRICQARAHVLAYVYVCLYIYIYIHIYTYIYGFWLPFPGKRSLGVSRGQTHLLPGNLQAEGNLHFFVEFESWSQSRLTIWIKPQWNRKKLE